MGKEDDFFAFQIAAHHARGQIGFCGKCLVAADGLGDFADGGRAGVFCCKPLLRLCIGTAFFGYHLFFSLVNQAV